MRKLAQKILSKDDKISKNTQDLLKQSLETVPLYDLKPNESLKEITQAVLGHPNTPESVKRAITQNHHKYYVFTYPSDGLTIKAYISLPQNTIEPVPLIILLRGGNRLFCTPHPGEFSAQPGYCVIATTIRGGVSEGEDEFGGNDVNDVKNLFSFLTVLEQKLLIQFHPTQKYMVGISRGGLELFLAIGRYPELQLKIRKVVSVTGMLDLKQAIEERRDVKNTMIKDFGYTDDDRGKSWLAWRQPMNYIPKISKHLPILIIQGTQDLRISRSEGINMKEALEKAGNDVTYMEIENAEHMLVNMPGAIPKIIEWLEK